MTKHGHCIKKRGKRCSITYTTWRCMWRRVTDENHRAYMYYGGRGISIDPRWKDFSVFLADMGRRPSKKHTLDRLDTDGDYCFMNCAWATWKQQANNRRKAGTALPESDISDAF